MKIEQAFPVTHKIGNCVYKLPLDAPLPKPRRYHKKKFRPPATSMATLNAQAIKYLQWLYPKSKEIAKLCSSMWIRRIKDPESGKLRWLEFGKINSFKIEIPHWNFNADILEETSCLLS